MVKMVKNGENTMFGHMQLIPREFAGCRTLTPDGRGMWAHARAIASALACAHFFVPRQSAEKW